MNRGDRVGLPVRPFLWTLDQVATLMSLELTTVKISYIYYEGRSTGMRGQDRLLARNIAPRGEKPEWRVAHEELIRWMKHKGFRFYEEGRLRN